MRFPYFPWNVCSTFLTTALVRANNKTHLALRDLIIVRTRRNLEDFVYEELMEYYEN